jgi:hypothetical protein
VRAKKFLIAARPVATAVISGIVLCAALLLNSFNAFADECQECKVRCDSEKGTECAVEADDEASMAGCLAVIAACRARCQCPDAAAVTACEAKVGRDHDRQVAVCRIQFAENPTGCLDESARRLVRAKERCAVDPSGQ